MRFETLTSEQQAVLNTKESLIQQMKSVITANHQTVAPSTITSHLQSYDDLIRQAQLFIDTVNEIIKPDFYNEFESVFERKAAIGEIATLKDTLSERHQQLSSMSKLIIDVKLTKFSGTHFKSFTPSPLTTNVTHTVTAKA